jgi:predicted nucleic acid-binding protein
VSFVLDASIAACWAFEDEGHPIAAAAWDRLGDDGEARVPALWWFEVRNVMLVNERRGRIAQADVVRFLGALARFRIVIDSDPVSSELLNLARRYRLTAYDAAYLELALREGVALLTLDDRLAKAASDSGAPSPRL